MLEDGFVEIKGVRLHYVKGGAGSPVIFQHGYGHSWRYWKNQLAEFEKDHQVAAFDLLGFGDSDRPLEVEKYKMGRLMAYITGLADHLGFKKFTLVAHSVSGLGWIYAALLSDRLDKLVIFNAPHPNIAEREYRDNPAQAKAGYYVPLIRGPGGEKLLSQNNYEVLRKDISIDRLKQEGKITEEEYTIIMEQVSRPGTMTAWCNYYRSLPLNDPGKTGWSEVKTPPMMIKVPTLVLWGMKDHGLLPGQLDGLDQYVPDLQIKRFANGTQQLALEEPETVNRYLREFLHSERST